MFVEGPTSLSEYKSNTWDMRIYIFGDWHEKKKKCPDVKKDINIMSIEKFFESTFTLNKEITIDFYLEEQFISKLFSRSEFTVGAVLGRREDRSNYLEDTSKYFDNCFQLIKSSCPYKNTRFHYIDIRFIPKSVLIYTFLLTADIINFNKNIERKEFVEELLPSIKNDMKLLYDKINEVSLSEIFQQTKVIKQFQNIQESYRPYVENYWTKVCLAYYNELKENIKHMLLYDGIKEKYDHNLLTVFPGLVMDAYTMGRVFRSFSNQGKTEQEKNVILYAGEWHKTNYENFLNYLHFNLIASSQSFNQGVDFQCLDVSRFHVPFFHT